MESFFHTLKTERVHHRIYASRADARRDLFGSHREPTIPPPALGAHLSANRNGAQSGLTPSTFSGGSTPAAHRRGCGVPADDLRDEPATGVPGDRHRPDQRALPGHAAGRRGLARTAKSPGPGRRRFGYRRLHVLLKREGQVVNKKRIQRIYREERLTVRRRGAAASGRSAPGGPLSSRWRPINAGAWTSCLTR